MTATLSKELMIEQLLDMQEYTRIHQQISDPIDREVASVNHVFPKSLMPWQPGDQFAGRVSPPIIGFGSVSSVGGVGHYCNFHKLDEFAKNLESTSGDEFNHEIAQLKSYWQANDTRMKYYDDQLEGDVIGAFVDVAYPAIITARLSGMYLDYSKLVKYGVSGLKALILDKASSLENIPSDEHAKRTLTGMAKSIDVMSNCIQYYIDHATTQRSANHSKEDNLALERIIQSLQNLLHNPPQSFHEAIQLTWLYSICAGVVNYGRMDEFLGEFLYNDIQSGVITRDEALTMTQSHFALIASRRTTFNSRIIIGGEGRTKPKIADEYCLLAIEASRNNADTEPQLTLRMTKDTRADIIDAAFESIGMGLTYPLLYNDDVLVPSVSKAFNIDRWTAQQYVPLGCGEIVISGKSIGTPNTCMNFLKILNIAMSGGIDYDDGKDKSYGVPLLQPSEVTCFDDVMNNFIALLDKYITKCAEKHRQSYTAMKEDAQFFLTSALIDDCIGRGKAVLDDGAQITGGTNEIYGAINAYNALAAVRDVIFEQATFSYQDLDLALKNNFNGSESLQNALLNSPKFGNDDQAVDNMVADLHRLTCTMVSDAGDKVGFNKYLVVLINNHVNTDWGRTTSASADGRNNGDFMANANNPQNGSDTNGPTAMLNSLAKLDTDIHAGTVQNLKLNKSLFSSHAQIPKALVKAHFASGGAQLMISVVDAQELEDAIKHPEKHQNLLVRVGGFSARFVELNPDIQREVLARTLNS